MNGEQRAAVVRKATTGVVTRDELNSQASKKQANPTVKTSRISFKWAGCTITIQSPNGLSIDSAIEMLESLLRECKKARTQGHDISSLIRMLRDRSRSQAAT